MKKSNGQRIRTIVIEDSSFMRRIINDILIADNTVEVVGEASNGKDGVELTMNLRPDVVITDMVMPEYDGLYVVRKVMEQHPLPIILLSSLGKANPRIFDALQGGAFEFIDKPTGLDSRSVKDYPLLDLVKYAANTDISLLKAKETPTARSISLATDDRYNYEIITIGASTGGPSAVETIVLSLPKNLSVPVVIAQHMPARFLETFAARLHTQSKLPVILAQKGASVKPGHVYIVPGETNTLLDSNGADDLPYFSFTNREFEEFNNPSVNCLFESVAKVYGKKSIGVILTGMGKDGMHGMKRIHEAGGLTVAQDETSSVVYGMPKAAVEANAVKKILSINDIPQFIINSL